MRSTRRRASRKASALVMFASMFTAINAVSMENRIVFDALRPILTARLDPIIQPGAISQHVHRILGASSFSKDYDPDIQRQAACTEIAPQADLSNYWHPAVYKVIVNQTTNKWQYAPMWGQTRLYYNFPQVLPGTGPGSYIEPFPYNFQMVAGNPAKKTGGGYSQLDLSIFYYCEQDYANGTIYSFESYDLPKVGCTFLVSKVWFPTCWNGNAYDPKNPWAHVAYPNLGGGLMGANCPPGYPRRIPGILLETFHFGASNFGPGLAGPWGGNGPDTPTYILANGDTTGYGMHGDFANGWDMNVLSQVVKQCTYLDFDLNAGQSCAPLTPSWSYDKGNACYLNQNTVIPGEPVGFEGYLDALPGCNLPWASGPKPTCGNTYVASSLTPWSRYVGKEQTPSPSIQDLAKFAALQAAAVSPVSSATSSTTSSTTSSISSTSSSSSSTSPFSASSSSSTSRRGGLFEPVTPQPTSAQVSSSTSSSTSSELSSLLASSLSTTTTSSTPSTTSSSTLTTSTTSFLTTTSTSTTTSTTSTTPTSTSTSTSTTSSSSPPTTTSTSSSTTITTSSSTSSSDVPVFTPPTTTTSSSSTPPTSTALTTSSTASPIISTTTTAPRYLGFFTPKAADAKSTTTTTTKRGGLFAPKTARSLPTSPAFPRNWTPNDV